MVILRRRDIEKAINFSSHQDLRMRYEKLGFEIASMSVDRDENMLYCVSPSNNLASSVML